MTSNRTDKDKNIEHWLEGITKSYSKTSNNEISYRGVFSILVLIFVIVGVAGYLNQNISANIENNWNKTSAVVADIKLRYNKVNDMDGTTILNYTIFYSFTSGERIYNGKQIVDKYYYDTYFSEKLKVNDTIVILYNQANPKQNKIKQID